MGRLHFYKLKHQVDTKYRARGAVTEPYTLEEQPSKSSKSSAQAVGILDTFSLLSGDATAFLDDAFGIKSQKNDDYWVAVQKGSALPQPKTPFIAEKFLSMLIGAGIDLKQEGSEIVAAPLTDKEIMKMSHGEITKPTALKASNLMPEKGGLFDTAKTGGVGGSRFNHITLAEPIVNPLMRDAITSVGKLKSGAELEKILDGKLAVTEGGTVTSDLAEGSTHGAGVVNLLKGVDVDRELTVVKAEVKLAKGDKLNKSHKRLRYLRALKKLKLSPEEAYTNKYVTIIPAKFRQVQPLASGSLNVAPANHSYREILLINNQLKDLKKAGISDENLSNLRGSLNKAVSGLVGITAPLTRGTDFSGFVEYIKGKGSPKTGLFHSKVVKRTQDLSARSTVIPNPKLGLDEVAIPKEMGMEIYKPFVVRKLVGLGFDPLVARNVLRPKTS